MGGTAVGVATDERECLAVDVKNAAGWPVRERITLFRTTLTKGLPRLVLSGAEPAIHLIFKVSSA